MPINDTQKVSKQHAVPQNIMDVDFKIIGDLTMRQFFYLVICGGSAYGVFLLLQGSIFRWPLIVLFSGLGVFLAFVPVEDRGLDQWVVSFFKAVYSPTQRVWRKEPELSAALAYQSASFMKQELITLAPTSSRRKLEEYLDRAAAQDPIDPLDVQVKTYVDMVHNAFTKSAAAGTVVALEEPEIIDEAFFPFEPTTSSPPAKEMHSVQQPQPSQLPKLQEEVPQEQKTTLPKTKEVEEVAEAKIQKQPEIIRERPQKTTMQSAPMTPDMHSGRRFTSLLPDKGEIILPIRGERVITNEEVTNNEDIQLKTDQLRQLLDQIKSHQYKTADGEQKETGQHPLPLKEKTFEAPTEISHEAESTIKDIDEENKQLASEIDRLKKELEKNSAQGQNQSQEQGQTKQKLKQLENKKAQAFADYQRLLHKVKDLQEHVEKREQAVPEPIGAVFAQQDTGNQKVFPKITEPNIISGLVENNEGKAIQGAIIIIKNKKGETSRAIKTNKLGQFFITTQLMDGVYTAEVANANKLDLSFDIMRVDITGAIIPPIEFIGKA